MVRFAPGARTAWHTDPNGQTIFVTEGIGLAKRRGGEVEVIRPGDRVFFEPGEDHWHGASPNRFMIHLALIQLDEAGNGATWGDHVTDGGSGGGPPIDGTGPDTNGSPTKSRPLRRPGGRLGRRERRSGGSGARRRSSERHGPCA